MPAANDKAVSAFKPPPERSPLVRQSRELLSEHSSETGFATLFSAEDAFLTRRKLMQSATSSLDLQYYIWELDQTGTLLVHELRTAADRGVRVRLLLDDINRDHEGFGFELLDAHPNIEVRLFNPFPSQSLKLLSFLFEADRLNHRMHNKLMVADSTFAVMGGRNIGDDYFGADKEANFRDLDLLLAGEVVKPLIRSFDAFWNSRWSIPMANVGGSLSASEKKAQRAAFDEKLIRLRDFPYASLKEGDQPAQERQRWHWGRATLYLNEPVEHRDRVISEIEPMIRQFMGQARRELLIETAYFIPLEKDIELFSQLVRRGVEVKILTNSLATTDVAASHAGYMDSRKELLQAGVQLFELRPDALEQRKELAPIAGSSKAALHSKIIVVDRERVLQGSFNLDPRSMNINTEIGLAIESPSLTAEVVDFIHTGMHQRNSYELAVEGQELVWLTLDGSRTAVYRREPEVGCWQRMMALMMSWLPIKQQL